MPISFAIDEPRHLLRSKVEGPVTTDEILSHVDAMRRDQLLSLPEIVDANGAGPPYLTTVEIRRLAGIIEGLGLPKPLGPRAVIAGNDIVFGLARVFTNRVWGELPVQVFRDLESAEDWLAKKSPPPAPRKEE